MRIEPDQMKNATVHILAINNILNEIGEHYGGAYGIEPEKENQTTATQNKIVNMADYQSAESLAKIASADVYRCQKVCSIKCYIIT